MGKFLIYYLMKYWNIRAETYVCNYSIWASVKCNADCYNLYHFISELSQHKKDKNMTFKQNTSYVISEYAVFFAKTTWISSFENATWINQAHFHVRCVQ